MAYGSHPIFNDPLFRTSEYARFKLEVRGACALAQDNEPHLAAIKKAIPSVHEHLRMVSGSVQAYQTTMSSEMQKMGEEVKSLRASVDDFLQGSFSFQFTPGKTRMLPQGFDSALHRRRASSPSPCPSAARPIAPSVSVSTHAPPAPTPVEEPARVAPAYKLSREVRTIPDLWREWTVGLAGLPSVEDLDRMYGARWRCGNERQYYSTRKVIIGEIKRRAGDAATDVQLKGVVAQMEEERLASKLSLDKVVKALKRAARERA